MAFVLEEIPEDKLEKYGRDGVKTWVIDQEKNIKLIYEGAFSYDSRQFELHWKNNVIRMNLDSNYIEEENPENEGVKYITTGVKHEISQITIPDQLRNKENSIKNHIKNSLMIFGKFGRLDKKLPVKILGLNKAWITYKGEVTSIFNNNNE